MGGARTGVYRGAAMAVALTWSLRAIGLVSVFILARLLDPADFGVIGLAMIVVALVEIFSYLGLRQALLRLPGASREHYDTAFTFQLIVFAALACVLVAIAGPVAGFYDEPRVEPVIYALAGRFVMTGLTNIGVVEFDRQRDFGRDLKLRASARIASFFVTVGLALTLRNYWALVGGMLVQEAILVALSYTMQPYRPRLSLARRAELLGVSLWIFAGVAAQAIHSQIERMVVGRTAGTEVLGAFAVSKDLSYILTQEIATALNRVTFVQTAEGGAFSEQGGRIARALGGYAMIAAPMGLGLAAVAEEFVAVVLGAKWAGAAPLVPPIAAASALMAVYKLAASSLQAGGHERASALASLGGLAALTLVVLAIAASGAGPLAIAQGGLAVTAGLLFGGIGLVARYARHGFVDLVISVVRPFLAAGVMLLALGAMPTLSDEPLIELAWRGAAGAAIYGWSLLGLWALGGRGDTAEGEAVRLCAEALKARRRARGT